MPKARWIDDVGNPPITATVQDDHVDDGRRRLSADDAISRPTDVAHTLPATYCQHA